MEKLTEKYRGKYRISSIRLGHWDYRWNGAYYITICTKNRTCYFGNIVNGTMQLSNIGIVADDILTETENHSTNIKLGPYVIMPNHVHVILLIEQPDSNFSHNDQHENRNIHNNRNFQYNRNIQYNRRDKACLVSTTYMKHQWYLTHQSYTNNHGDEINRSNSEKTIGQQRFQNQGANSISSIVGSYKSAVTKNVHRLGYEFEWQGRFYDHIIRDENSFKRISSYIYNNPKNWMKDRFRYSP